jgi:hypothetical protein
MNLGTFVENRIGQLNIKVKAFLTPKSRQKFSLMAFNNSLNYLKLTISNLFRE